MYGKTGTGKTLSVQYVRDEILKRIKKDADFVVLIEQEEKVYLVAPISVFEKSIKQNFGHGEQEFIPENKFEVATNPAGACAIMQKHNTIKPKQHKLF